MVRLHGPLNIGVRLRGQIKLDTLITNHLIQSTVVIYELLLLPSVKSKVEMYKL